MSVGATLKRELSGLPMFLALPTLSLGVALGQGRRIQQLLSKRMYSSENKRRAFAGYVPSEHDVFVCTYSRSGTNWMMQLAFQIAQRGAGEFANVHDVIAWPDAFVPGIVSLRDENPWRQSPTGLRVIKTHFEAPFVPYSGQAKYIVVARDPKEAFVSSYHFFDGLIPGLHAPSAELWLQDFLSGRFFFGSWSEHLASYWSWRERSNVAWLTFNDMKSDLPGVAHRIAELMGVTLTPAELASVVERSRFDDMKQIDDKFLAEPVLAERLFRRSVRPAMMRQGAVGRSSELITHEQQCAIDARMQAELSERGCDFPYAQYFRPTTRL
jgi:hypothetical protein